MSSYKVEQCHLRVGGRKFHFVSYDGHPANERRGEAAAVPMWYLMGPGRRWPVVPQIPGQSDDQIEQRLLAWIQSSGLDRSASAS